MKRIAAVLAGVLAIAWWLRRERYVPADRYDELQRDDYLWSVLSGGEDR